MSYIQSNSPFLKVRKTTKGKGRNFLSTEEGAGMTEAGVKKYREENHFVLDQKAGPVKEVKLLEKDGNVKTNIKNNL